MADPQQHKPQVVVDPAEPRTQTYAEPRAGAHPGAFARQRKPAGPQLWAVVFTVGGLYYLWTKILGKSLPGFVRRSGHRVGAKGHGSSSSSSSNRQAEIQAARERQQQRLQNAARAHEMVKQATSNNNSGNIRERNVTSSGNKLSIQEQQHLLRQQQQQKQKQQEIEAKKKKQRELYLKQKKEKENEEETKRKDAELGPGWRHREDPNAGNAVNSMDPQSGSSGGGYKPQVCTKRGG